MADTSDHAEDMDVDALVAQGSELVDAILRRTPLTDIQSLIEAGAPVWYQDDEGTSPLHAAAYIEDDTLVRILIDEGAVWNAGACIIAGGLHRDSEADCCPARCHSGQFA